MQISFGETMLDLDLRKAPLYLSNVNYWMLLQIGSSIRSPSMCKPFSASVVGSRLPPTDGLQPYLLAACRVSPARAVA